MNNNIRGSVLSESALAFSLVIIVVTIAGLILFGAFKKREEKVRDSYSGSDLCLNCIDNCDKELCPK